MGITYFNGLSWQDLSRDERFYCFCLYQKAKSNPRQFAELVASKSGLNVESTDEWDVAVEVCFYRDYLWHKGKPVHGSGFSPKRTFDLCLFSSNAIIIIEAKVDQPFDTEQNKVFAEDSKKIRQLLGNEKLNIYLVALASSKYYKADANNGSGDALRPFNGHISWSDMYQKYGDEIFNQAENLYGSDKRKLIS
jgi:hypothetical protein